MRYVSTRGLAAPIDFRSAVLAGLASDGGLYVPEQWPALPSAFLEEAATARFSDIAAAILSLFAEDELSVSDLRAMAERAFAPFDHPDTAPVTALGGEDYLLELFHGPTLAFKDVAMRMLGELYGWALDGASGGKTIIGATSGDTGGAAISAFAGKERCEVFMLHPKGRISDVQRRMMTTVDAPNITNIAIDGSFDDCQRIVKTLFGDDVLSQKLALGGVNSINWVRLAVQTVYYVTACARFDGPVSFVVPTGNFGDAFAGYVAARMGAPIRRIAVAVNRNDIMRRAIEDGVYAPAEVAATSSPSMDIQVASNFERMLFDALGRDAAALRRLMSGFEKNRRMEIPESVREIIAAHFCAEMAGEAEVADKIGSEYAKNGRLVDPHTAVGLAALEKLRRAGRLDGPAVSLATAHPAKFPDAVEKASGVRPGLPPRFDNLAKRPEKMQEAAATPEAVRALILERSLFA